MTWYVIIRSGRPKSSTTKESFIQVKDKIIDDRQTTTEKRNPLIKFDISTREECLW